MDTKYTQYCSQRPNQRNMNTLLLSIALYHDEPGSGVKIHSLKVE